MLEILFRTSNTIAPLFLRIFLGAIMFPHGAQKVFGWFGGNAFTATIHYFTQSMNLPYPVALLVILAEFLGSIGLIVGCLTRVAALGIGSVMVGAIVTVHAQYGFFMNWSGQQTGEGFEYHLLAIGMALALLVTGGGTASLDLWLTRKFTSRREN